MPQRIQPVLVVERNPASVITEWMCGNCRRCERYGAESDDSTVPCSAAAALSLAAHSKKSVDFEAVRFIGLRRFIRRDDFIIVSLIDRCFHFKEKSRNMSSFKMPELIKKLYPEPNNFRD